MRIVFIVILGLITISCDKENRCLDQPGELTTISVGFSFTVNHFVIQDDLNVSFIRDSLNRIEISGGKNMVNNVLIEESSNKVYIKNLNKCLFVSKKDDIDIRIHYSNLKNLELLGYGNISFSDSVNHNLNIFGEDCYANVSMNLNNDSTTITLEGAPQITAHGSSNYLYAYCVGSGNYDMQNLETIDCHGHTRSDGDFHLRASQSYLIELRSRGDVYLYDTLGTNRVFALEGEGNIYYEN